jgi:fructokinase
MKTITAIGEIIFDIYPGYKTPGGAALNFIYHIYKLTGNSRFISRVGNDPEGKEALEFLGKNEIPVSHIQIDNFHETGTARANLDENKIPHWEISLNKAYDFIDIPADSDKIIESSKCFYFGSLAQRMERSRKTIQSFLGRNMKYIFDMNIRQNYYTKDILETSLLAADVLKVNEEELNLLHELFLAGKFELNQSVSDIKKEFNIELAAVTQGDRGAWLFRDKEKDFYKAPVNNAVDTTGAGDAYSAILCLGYLKNLDLNKVNKLASDFAVEIVKLTGAIPRKDNIYEKFKMIDD